MRTILRCFCFAALCLGSSVSFATLYEFKIAGDASVSIGVAAPESTRLTISGTGDPASSTGSLIDWGVAGGFIQLSGLFYQTPSFVVKSDAPLGAEFIEGITTSQHTNVNFLPSGEFIDTTGIIPVDWLGVIDPRIFESVYGPVQSWIPNRDPNVVTIPLRLIDRPQHGGDPPAQISSTTRTIHLEGGGSLTYNWIGNVVFSAVPVVVIPEPSTGELLSIAMLLLVAARGPRAQA
jgi:hypothetical protein